MFYTYGIDITNDKQMFNFLKGHFRYATMNSWNGEYSIAHNVKIHRLNLTGDCWTALALLENGEYEMLNDMIKDWEREHPGYTVGFNGRSGGYLVLYNADNRRDVLPHSITDNDDYSQYKEWCRYYGYTVKENRFELQMYTKLVRDFDRLCDELRKYVDGLSNLKFEKIEMDKAVEDFNYIYADDLEYLGFDELTCDAEGKVDCFEIRQLVCLMEAFVKLADRSDSGYSITCDDEDMAYYEHN
jgi:hypothetical protein